MSYQPQDPRAAQHQRLRVKYPTLECYRQIRANECGIKDIEMIYDSWFPSDRPSAFVNLARRMNIYNQYGCPFPRLGTLLERVGLGFEFYQNTPLKKYLKHLNPKQCCMLLSCFNLAGQLHAIVIDDALADGNVIIRDPALAILEKVDPTQDMRFGGRQNFSFYIIEPYPAGEEYDAYEDEFDRFNAKHSRFLDTDGQASHKYFKGKL